MQKEIISASDAPSAIGTYSQAVKVDKTVYMSGQIPLVAETGELLQGSIEEQISLVFDNVLAIAKAAGGDLSNVVKFNVYLTDLNNFGAVNAVMEKYLEAPYPARAAVEVAALPKGAPVEVEAILVIE